MITPQRDAQAGVTLVEMLVALAVFALVGLACLAILDTIIRVRDRTEGLLASHAAIDRALIVFSRDLEQSVPGDVALRDAALTFRREVATGALRLRYAILDGALLREITNETGAMLSQQVLGDVQAMGLRFLDGSLQWQETWPPEAGGGDLRAVELRLQLGPEGAGSTSVLRLAEMPRAIVP